MEPQFSLLGIPHLTILASMPVAAALLVWWSRRHPGQMRAIQIGLGWLLLAAGPGWHLYRLLRGWLRYPSGLPITICDVSLLLSALALLTLRSWAYEFAYYNAFGALGAVITPDLWESFPSLSTLQFFTGHCGVLVAVLFLTWSGTLRPRPGSARRVFAALNLLVAAVAVFDLLTGANYLYLRQKPADVTLLDYLGPWPFYLIACEAAALAIFTLLERPFRRKSKRSGGMCLVN